MTESLGPYTLVQQLAVGGHAEIYLAKKGGMVGFEKFYAIKAMLPQQVGDAEAEQVMMDEARLTAQLQHDNVVTVHDLGKDGDRVFMVMEYVRGQDLSTMLGALRKVNGLMAIEVAAYVGAEIAAGLHYVHTRNGKDGEPLNLVHRDISPQNILLGIDGDVKIIDFGVAKLRGAGRIETKTGVIKGKLKYMAPEYAIGNQQDVRSDIFSTALCLYEMIGGRPAYDDAESEPSELIERIKTADIEPLVAKRADVPDALAAIIMKALSPHPDDRYQTAFEFQEALSTYLATAAPGFTKGHFATYTARLLEKLGIQPSVPSEVDGDSAAAQVSPHDTPTASNPSPVPAEAKPHEAPTTANPIPQFNLGDDFDDDDFEDEATMLHDPESYEIEESDADTGALPDAETGKLPEDEDPPSMDIPVVEADESVEVGLDLAASFEEESEVEEVVQLEDGDLSEVSEVQEAPQAVEQTAQPGGPGWSETTDEIELAKEPIPDFSKLAGPKTGELKRPEPPRLMTQSGFNRFVKPKVDNEEKNAAVDDSIVMKRPELPKLKKPKLPGLKKPTVAEETLPEIEVEIEALPEIELEVEPVPAQAEDQFDPTIQQDFSPEELAAAAESVAAEMEQMAENQANTLAPDAPTEGLAIPSAEEIAEIRGEIPDGPATEPVKIPEETAPAIATPDLDNEPTQGVAAADYSSDFPMSTHPMTGAPVGGDDPDSSMGFSTSLGLGGVDTSGHFKSASDLLSEAEQSGAFNAVRPEKLQTLGADMSGQFMAVSPDMSAQLGASNTGKFAAADASASNQVPVLDPEAQKRQRANMAVVAVFGIIILGAIFVSFVIL